MFGRSRREQELNFVRQGLFTEAEIKESAKSASETRKVVTTTALISGLAIVFFVLVPQALASAPVLLFFAFLVFIISVVSLHIANDQLAHADTLLLVLKKNRKPAGSKLPEEIHLLEKINDSSSDWLATRVRPEKQPFGVSDQGAESYVAEWFRYLGYLDAEVTVFSGDGGIDVQTEEYVCQVKNYRDKAVSVTEVRELLGVAASERKRAVLFSSSSYTAQAIDFANKNDICLVRFLATEGRLEWINDAGCDFLVNGEYEDS